MFDIRHDVEEDVSVNQYGGHSVFAGQRHDGVGTQCDVAAAIALAGRSANDAHDLAIELELYFRLRQQTRPLADFSRDGHLTL
ncbi:MAG: hypothetical protein WCC64_05615 [Aliidongia sp.]